MAERPDSQQYMTKEEKYRELARQAGALLEGELPASGALANFAALLQDTMGFFWTGFYYVPAEGSGKLLLGPFEGLVACFEIPFGRGVCGTAWKEEKTIVVEDVEEFPGHIACSSLSRSEIVVPVFAPDGSREVIGVLDIDSKEKGTFDETDRKCLEEIVPDVARFLEVIRR